MPATVGPQSFTVGSATNVVDPNQRGGNPSAAVQIQNSSPYQLNVLAGGEQLSIQPFFAQTVEISGAPTTITPLAVTGQTAACVITLSFLLGTPPGTGIMLPDGTGWVEPPPQQDGPLTAAAIAAALSTQGSVDLLGSGNAGPLIQNTVLTLGAFTALHAYNTLLVYLVNNSNANCPVIFAGAVNTTVFPPIGVPIGYESQASPMEVRPFSASPVVNFLLPFATQTGNTLVVQITNTGATINSISYLVFGLTAPLATQVTNPLGNPLGTSERGGLTRAKTTLAAAGSATMLVAPAAGTAYRLQRLLTSTGGGVTLAEWFGLSTGDLLSFGVNSYFDNLLGWTLTEGITVTSVGGGSTFFLWFDTIPTPAIS